MPVRRTPLVTGEYYHIYNRGVERRPTFVDNRDRAEILLGLRYYLLAEPPVKLSLFKVTSKEERAEQLANLNQTVPKLADLLCFVLMPNHFHLLAKQRLDGGLSTLLRRWINSYTRYFNTKHGRVGPLFQGIFQAVHIETSEQLIHVSRYIHLNPVASAVIRQRDLFTYRWSSFPDYVRGTSELYDLKPVLEHFPSLLAYQQFVLDRAGDAQQLEMIKHLVLEK